MKYIFIIINLLFISAFSILGREDIIPSSVSKISADFENGKVALKWIFPKILDKNILIYRHTSAISNKYAL
ncbi:MAG TPA: hypothetical protein PK899_08300, partial [Spirochaetota bacterium]|nr:hypothetical protein [Spirochaetota bacterium]